MLNSKAQTHTHNSGGVTLPWVVPSWLQWRSPAHHRQPAAVLRYRHCKCVSQYHGGLTSPALGNGRTRGRTSQKSQFHRQTFTPATRERRASARRGVAL